MKQWIQLQTPQGLEQASAIFLWSIDQGAQGVEELRPAFHTMLDLVSIKL